MDFTNLEIAANRYAKYVIQQSRTNLTKNKNGGGALYNSLDYKIIEDEYDILVQFLMEDYGTFHDQGVKGAKSVYPQSSKSPFKYRNKMPPTRVFDQWVIKRKIAPRDKKGRFLSRKSLKYLIARSIFEKGLKATNFFSKPFERGINKYLTDFENGFVSDINNEIKDL